MDPSLDRGLAPLFALVLVSLVGVVIAIVALVRGGRAVQFPDLGVRAPRGRSATGDHVSIP